MIILPSISSSLEFYSVHHSSIYENSESKDFKNIKDLCEISNKWSNEFRNKCIEDSWILLVMDVNNF